MEILLTFIFAFWLGSRLKEAFMRMIFRDILKDLGVTEQQLRTLAKAKDMRLPEDNSKVIEDEIPEIEIKIEQHQGQLYAFRMDTDQFLAQGIDRESLVANIAEKYKNIKFRVPKDQGADLIRNG